MIKVIGCFLVAFTVKISSTKKHPSNVIETRIRYPDNIGQKDVSWWHLAEPE